MTHFATVEQLLRERKTKSTRISGAREELKEQEVLVRMTTGDLAKQSQASVMMGYWLGVAQTLESL